MKFVKTRRSSSNPMLSPGLLIGKLSFHGKRPCTHHIECSAHKMLFTGHIIKKFCTPNILHLNIEGLRINKMTVLHHFAKALSTLFILPQDTHFTTIERLVIANFGLAGSFLSMKHDLAKLVPERLYSISCGQSPSTSDAKLLCVDIDGYKMINIYQHPPMRLQTSDLLVFLHPSFCADNLNSTHTD